MPREIVHTDARDYWGDAFVPLSKNFFAIAAYRLCGLHAAVADVGDPQPPEILLVEAARMFWEGVIPEAEFKAVRDNLEPYLDKKGRQRWKEILRQRHIKEYGVEP